MIDPEDVQMHYTAMLCYRGLGKTTRREREEKLFRRFKADESSQAITAQPAAAQPGRQQRAAADPRARERAAAQALPGSKTVITDQRKPAATRTGGNQQ